MQSRAVTVLSTGGTIASTGGENGATPSKDGEALTAAVPGLNEYADITVEEVSQTPSFDIDFKTLATLARRARVAIDAGADGVVVTHGTDTMEETAYYLDLVLDSEKPVVLTGAQRRPDEVSPDGHSNLNVAVRAATHDRFQGEGGVYIAFGEELHAARDVTKGHTSTLSTFVSPDKGPVARFTRADIRLHRQPGSYSTSVDTLETSQDVVMIKSACGTGTQQIRCALEDDVDGIVVEGTGLGNTTSVLGDAIGETIDEGVPVVITSRCHAGAVAPVYGTPGGGATLESHGVISGADLPAHKARIKLMLLLETVGDDVDALRDAFER